LELGNTAGIPGLTKTQRRIRQGLLAAIRPGIHFLVGPSGAGKTTILDSCRDEFVCSGATVKEVGWDFEERYVAVAGTLVVPLLPQQWDRLRNKVSATKILDEQSRFVASHVVPAMSRDEFEAVRIAKASALGIRLDEVPSAEICLGLPTLLDAFCPYVPEPAEAVRIAGGYLRRQFPWALDDKALAAYFQVAVLDEVLSFARDTTRRDQLSLDFYGVMASALERRGRMAEKSGNRYLSPLFRCQESADMYRNVWYGSRPVLRNGIEIYAPAVPLAKLETLERELGWSGSDFYQQWSRLCMCCGGLGKVGMWTGTGAGARNVYAGEKSENIDVIAGIRRQRIRKGLFKALGTDPVPEGCGDMLVRSFEHDGYPNPAFVGVAVESLLQRLDVSYVAHNLFQGSVYLYLAEECQIVRLEEMASRTCQDVFEDSEDMD